MSTDINSRPREVWIDWMRVSACFLVMMVHSTEPFYLGGDGTLILTKADAIWASFFDTFARACVPIFVVASSYLQFPLHYSSGEFLRRRASRILIPFVIWSCIYALIWGEPVQNFKDLVLNFNYAAGHLWFVYMLIGVYLLMPLLSPWAEKVSRKELLVYLALCFGTSFIPFIREAMTGGQAPIVYGPGGIPMQGAYPLWGEASWNEFGAFYYLSGFIGYMLLGLYLRRFASDMPKARALAIGIPAWIAGFVICFWGFLKRVFKAGDGVFPVSGDVSMAVGFETPWYNNTTGVVLMTIGWLMIFRLCTSSGWFYEKVILPVSKASYGMYLSHMVILSMFAGLLRRVLGIGADGLLGPMTTPVEILGTNIASFVCVAIACIIIQKIPKAGRWIIG